MPTIAVRPFSAEICSRLIGQGFAPLLARLYAARGVKGPDEVRTELSCLLGFESLRGVHAMAEILADAIRDQKRLLIVADYDADGATACAVGLRALRAFGARAEYLVPSRFEFGYGLTPELAAFAARTRAPDLLITVDNGIASLEGVAMANRLGMPVLITDHHLPAERLPDALCIVNPNQPGCPFPSKHLAGVGVMFYVMLALRAELRSRGSFAGKTEPRLADLLDLVALGTVADVAKLDCNNRILVHQGLQRIRRGRAQAGIAALFRAAGRPIEQAGSHDLGFVVGPRLNAAGRLEDMSLGIECLITDDPGRAQGIAARLDALNRERRELESQMHEEALRILQEMPTPEQAAYCLFDPAWHQGVVGILASRMKDRLHRPVVAFARHDDGKLKGSGRSVRGLHLRDALDGVAKRHPGLLLQFGGHAAAAGVTLREADLPRFEAAFIETVAQLMNPADLQRRIETDGSLEPGQLNLESALLLEGQVWGHDFPLPGFNDVFRVERQRRVGGRHLKLSLGLADQCLEAILFNAPEALPERIHAVYRLDANRYNGLTALQLVVDHWEAADGLAAS